jgi:hypothetical protein
VGSRRVLHGVRRWVADFSAGRLMTCKTWRKTSTSDGVKMADMKRPPWLVIGTIAGAAAGYLAIPSFQHGWLSEVAYLYRPLWGALIGLGIGAVIDIGASRLRR